jgi:hypothetical protein
MSRTNAFFHAAKARPKLAIRHLRQTIRLNAVDSNSVRLSGTREKEADFDCTSLCFDNSRINAIRSVRQANNNTFESKDVTKYASINIFLVILLKFKLHYNSSLVVCFVFRVGNWHAMHEEH